MIGPTELRRYQEMTVDERLREFDRLMDAAFEFLTSLPPDEQRRRWALWTSGDEAAASALADLLAERGG